jgi:hypothetical protein
MALVGGGWALVLMGLYLKRLAGIEIMCVLQFSWLNLVVVNNSSNLYPHLFWAILPLKYSVGYNRMFFEDSSPYSLRSPYTAQFGLSLEVFANNFNISLILLILPTALSVGTFIRYKLFVRSLSRK